MYFWSLKLVAKETYESHIAPSLQGIHTFSAWRGDAVHAFHGGSAQAERRLKALSLDETEHRANSGHSAVSPAGSACRAQTRGLLPNHALLPGDVVRLCPTATCQHTVLQQPPGTRLCRSSLVVHVSGIDITLPDPESLPLYHTIGQQYYSDQFACHHY